MLDQTDTTEGTLSSPAAKRHARHRGAWSLTCTMLLGASVAAFSAGVARAYIPADAMPNQTGLDAAATGADTIGKWGDAPGGVAGRPYLKSLTLTNGSTVTKVLENGTVSSTAPTESGTITATIEPYNLCPAGTSGTSCYASPNRMGVTVGYVKGANHVGYNFDAPTGDDNTTPLALLTTVDANTVIEAVINMNTWGDKLRWTWMNGVPSYWKIDNRGAKDSEITVRLQLATGPSQICTTRVPVSACDPSEPIGRDGRYEPEPMLRGNFVLSLDATGVSEALNGVLFASTNADIGSLDAEVAGAPLSYGIVGPSEMNGSTNQARFSAFVADASLLNHFGVTPDVVGTDAFRDSSLVVSRADGGSSGTPAWTRWTAAANGTDGWFLDITGIQFNGLAVAGSHVGALAQTSPSQPAKITVKPKGKLVVNARRKKTTVSLTMSARAPVCARSACRVVVRRLTSPYASTTKKGITVRVTRKSKSVRVSARLTAPKGQSITAVLQAKQGNRWVYVASLVKKT